MGESAATYRGQHRDNGGFWQALGATWRAALSEAESMARERNREYSDFAARCADLKAVKGGLRTVTQCVRGDRSRWRATGPVQVPTGKRPPLYPLRRYVREVKTDLGHKGTWLCERGAAAWERRPARAHGEEGRRPAAPLCGAGG